MSATQVLLKELRELTSNPVEGFRVSVDEDDMLHWKVIIFGPPDTIYEGGCFRAELKFPTNYPFAPPKMRFTTPMWHPNIYRSGEICISTLHPPTEDPLSNETPNERWNPALGVRTVLVSAISLLNEPNISSPANVEASIQYRSWRDKKNDLYERTVKQQVEQSKKEALKDGIQVPQNIKEYLSSAKNDKKVKKEREEVDVFADMDED